MPTRKQLDTARRVVTAMVAQRGVQLRASNQHAARFLQLRTYEGQQEFIARLAAEARYRFGKPGSPVGPEAPEQAIEQTNAHLDDDDGLELDGPGDPRIPQLISRLRETIIDDPHALRSLDTAEEALNAASERNPYDQRDPDELAGPALTVLSRLAREFGGYGRRGEVDGEMVTAEDHEGAGELMDKFAQLSYPAAVRLQRQHPAMVRTRQPSSTVKLTSAAIAEAAPVSLGTGHGYAWEMTADGLLVRDVEVMSYIRAHSRDDVPVEVDDRYLAKMAAHAEAQTHRGKHVRLLLDHNTEAAGADVIGRMQNIRFERPWVVGDALVTRRDTIGAIARGELPSRSAEFKPHAGTLWALSLVRGNQGHFEESLPDLRLAEQEGIEKLRDM